MTLKYEESPFEIPNPTSIEVLNNQILKFLHK